MCTQDSARRISKHSGTLGAIASRVLIWRFGALGGAAVAPAVPSSNGFGPAACLAVTPLKALAYRQMQLHRSLQTAPRPLLHCCQQVVWPHAFALHSSLAPQLTLLMSAAW